MKKPFKALLASLPFMCIGSVAAAQSKDAVLYQFTDTATDACGYKTAAGDTVIPLGKYLHCYTDHFKDFAIVNDKDSGLVGINRSGEIRFKIFVYDNGPDYPEEGLFRIIKHGRIGYADMQGNVLIQPQFDGAFPFEKGKAKVCMGCTVQQDSEHSFWAGGTWFFIDKKGNRVQKAATRKRR